MASNEQHTAVDAVTDAASPRSLSSLPNALLALVVAQLGVQEAVVALSLCCRRLHRLLSTDPTTYRGAHLHINPTLRARLRDTGRTSAAAAVPLSTLLQQVSSLALPRSTSSSPELLDFLSHCQPSFASLIVDCSEYQTAEAFLTPLLGPESPMFPQPAWSRSLTALNLRLVNDVDGVRGSFGVSAFIDPPSCFPVLHFLRLDHLLLSSADLSQLAHSERFPSLTHLDVHRCQLNDVFEPFPLSACALSPLLSTLCLPEKGLIHQQRLSADAFCDRLASSSSSFSAAAAKGRDERSGLTFLRIRASMTGDSVRKLMAGLPHATSLDVSDSAFSCCLWPTHIEAGLRSSTSSPHHLLQTLRIRNWVSGGEGRCSECEQRFGPAGEPNGVHTAHLPIDDTDHQAVYKARMHQLRRDKERAAAISAINTASLHSLFHHIGDSCTSLTFTFERRLQLDEVAAAGLCQLTRLQELALHFPSPYGAEEDPIEPSDELMTRPWQAASPNFSAMRVLHLHSFPFKEAALAAMLSSMPMLNLLSAFDCQVSLEWLLLLAHHCPDIERVQLSVAHIIDLSLSAWQRAAQAFPYLFLPPPPPSAAPVQAVHPVFPTPAAAPSRSFPRLRLLEVDGYTQSSRYRFDDAGWPYLWATVLSHADALHHVHVGFPLFDRQVLDLRHLPALRHLWISASQDVGLADAMLQAEERAKEGLQVYTQPDPLPYPKLSAAEQALHDRAVFRRGVEAETTYNARRPQVSEFVTAVDGKGRDGRAAFFEDLAEVAMAVSDEGRVAGGPRTRHTYK